MFKVLFHNDNKTPMQFVVDLLIKIFNKDQPKAHSIMMEVHTKGIGLAGVYPYEYAELKQLQSMKTAESKGYPLKITIEED